MTFVMGDAESGAKCNLHFLGPPANPSSQMHSRPPVSETNASLKRIQGDLWKMINEFRAKAIELQLRN